MVELDMVGCSIVQGSAPIFEQGHELGVNRTEHEQPPRDLIRALGQIVHGRLQVRRELVQDLAVEVLELVDRYDVPVFRQVADGLSQLAQGGGTSVSAGVDLERVQRIGERREDIP